MSEVSTPLLNPNCRQDVDSSLITDLCVTSRLSRPVQNVPLTTGLDLPKGLLHDSDGLAVRTPGGELLKLQSTPSARWSDGSVKWTLLDYVAPEVSSETSNWRVVRTEEASTSATDPAATFAGETIGLRLDGNTVVVRRGVQETRLHFVLTSTHGQKLQPKISHCRIECEGPVRWTVVYEGEFPNSRGLRFAIRVSTFQSTGNVKCDVKLHNPNRAAHKGGLWDLGDAGSVSFDSFHVECQRSTPSSTLHWKAEFDHAECSSGGGSLSIYQDSSGRDNWQSENHANATGRVPRTSLISSDGSRLSRIADGRSRRRRWQPRRGCP